MKRITMNDIAKTCGVSKATVSYVINDRLNKVSPSIVQKIKDTMNHLGYVPNQSAKMLAGKNSTLIGVIIPQLDTQNRLFINPFYSEFLSGLEYYLRLAGYHIVLSVINYNNKLDNLMMKWNLDGAVVFGINNEAMIETLGKNKMPTLLIDSYIDNPHYYRLNINDEEACFASTQLLIKEKHQQIVFVTGNLQESAVLQQRFNGYKKALHQAGLSFTEELVFNGEVSYEYGEQVALLLLNQYPSVKAIVTTADVLALGIVHTLQAKGKKLGLDYEVMGFDDTYQAKTSQPKLSTIRQHIAKRGELAGELIIKIIKKELTETHFLTHFDIVQRETTANKS